MVTRVVRGAVEDFILTSLAIVLLQSAYLEAIGIAGQQEIDPVTTGYSFHGDITLCWET